MSDLKNTAYSQDFIKLTSQSGSDEDVHYSLFCEELPEEYKIIAEKTLNETAENKQKGLRKLKAYIEKGNLATCTEYELIGVLRCAKYNFKKAEGRLKKYLKFRQELMQLVANMDDTKTQTILDDMCLGFLPYRDKHGRAIGFTRPTFNLDLYEMADVTPIGFALILYIYSFPLTTVAGASYIAECKTDTLSIFYPILKAFKGYVSLTLDMPLRIGRMDIVNENILVRWFLKFLLPLLSEKLSRKVFCNGNGYKTLQKNYHPDLLPEEFEGNLGPFKDEFFRERFLQFLEQLKTENMNVGQKRQN